MAKEKKNNPTDAVNAAQDQKPLSGHTFSVGEKSYQINVPVLNIPGIGVRTAQEVAVDDQEYDELGGKTIGAFLVEIGSGLISESL